MKLKLYRHYFGEKYTIGRLFIDNEYFCDVLEDTVRELNTADGKVYGKTAIPAGLYTVKLTYSPHFKRVLPEILDVPFFKYIRIHAGNDAEDSEGCLLVGENKVKGKVINSRKWETKLIDSLLTATDDITIEIINQK